MITLNSALAQEQGGDVEAFVSDTKTDLLIVVAGGLAGAVLGLSTLSFVEEPKKHTRNILVGASIGIIAGVGYVALSQATRSRDMFYQGEPETEEEPAYGGVNATRDFNTIARLDWHDSSIGETFSPIIAPIQVGHSFTF